MDDFIHGCQNRDGDSFWPLALWVTSPMDARGHYRWLHPWLPKLERKESLEHRCHRTHSENWNQFSIWSKTTAWIKNGLETYNADFKLQSRNLFNANLILWCQLSTENKFNVSGQKKKVRNTGKYSENRIPLSTIFRRLGAPHSVDRFSTLQVILVDRCPVPSDLQPGGRPSPKKKCATEPDRTYFRKYFKSMAKNWLFLIVNSWFWFKP